MDRWIDKEWERASRETDRDRWRETRTRAREAACFPRHQPAVACSLQVRRSFVACIKSSCIGWARVE